MSLINEIELKDVSDYGTEKIDAELLNSNNYISTDNLIPEKGGAVNSDYLPTKGRVSKYSVGDTLVSNIRPYFKKILFAKENGGCSNDVIVFKPKLDKIAPKYLYYQLSKDEFFDFMMAGANGVKMPRGNKNSIPLFKLLLPSIPTQRHIASILSAYDDLIENNIKRIKLLEEIAQRTYEEWFVKFRVNGKQLPLEDKTGLPIGWKLIELGSIVLKLESGSRPKGGIDKSLDHGIPSVGAESVLGLGQYKYGSEKLIKSSFFDKMRRGKIQNKDILIYKDGAYIGKTSMFQDEFPHKICAVNEHVFLINSGRNDIQNFLFFTLSREEYFQKMQSLNSNSAQPGINQEKIKSLELLYPNNELIVLFDKIAEPLTKEIFNLAKQNQKLKESRDILLPRLMNGTINVE
jgi:type I restriction enzyme S subunit